MIPSKLPPSLPCVFCKVASASCILPQVDLGVPKMVRGVITQGARGGDAGSGATTDNRAFVRKYKVAHSLNAKEWNFIMDSKFSLPKVGERERERA